ncbi:hypothetical protein E5288_WYG015051 [Bos mutus]|uniref:Uncharacterized protein n=1 Tax=Bos mutus TaxID=72004 RepID=A0A6B0RIF1_9CETA|nr:hypothetical protein [Bos mutus]
MTFLENNQQLKTYHYLAETKTRKIGSTHYEDQFTLLAHLSSSKPYNIVNIRKEGVRNLTELGSPKQAMQTQGTSCYPSRTEKD